MTYDPDQFDYEADEIPRPPHTVGPALFVMGIVVVMIAWAVLAAIGSLILG